ncbi:MAG: hypothetical protein WCP97_02745 [bacterium]
MKMSKKLITTLAVVLTVTALGTLSVLRTASNEASAHGFEKRNSSQNSNPTYAATKTAQEATERANQAVRYSTPGYSATKTAQEITERANEAARYSNPTYVATKTAYETSENANPTCAAFETQERALKTLKYTNPASYSGQKAQLEAQKRQAGCH